MEIIEHTLDDHKIFQILDVLDQDLFSNLQISKQKIYDFTGPNITSNEKVFYRIKNWKDLDSWEPHIGIDFVSYAKIIKNFFLNLNLFEFRLYAYSNFLKFRSCAAPCWACDHLACLCLLVSNSFEM